MSRLVISGGDAAVSLAEARDWLRLGPGDADANVAGLIRAASDLCEAFTGQMLIARAVSEERPAVSDWFALARQPVVAVEDVAVIEGSGPRLLAADAWEALIDATGQARVRVLTPVNAPVRVRYRAGLAEAPSALPEAVRHGIMRLVQQWHFGGTDAANDDLPAIVAALWSPWRRIGLGGRA